MKQRPSWQTEECPIWCGRDHQELDAGSDRDHQTIGESIAVIRATRWHDSVHRATQSIVSAEVTVQRSAPQGSTTSFLTVAVADEGSAGFDIAEESARRLVIAMQSELADGPPA